MVDDNPKLTCQICGRLFKGISFAISHAVRMHNISSKEYYDKYFKKENEDVCIVCGKPTKLKSIPKGYFKRCSRQCIHKDKNVINKTLETKLERYGDDYFKDIHKKTKNTKLEKYGDENYNNIEKAKITKLEKYGDENYNNIDKMQETMIRRYGYDNAQKVPEIKEKSVESYQKTCNEKRKKRGNLYNEFNLYSKEVRIETEKWKNLYWKCGMVNVIITKMI